jgi:hypothetical protein
MHHATATPARPTPPADNPHGMVRKLACLLLVWFAVPAAARAQAPTTPAADVVTAPAQYAGRWDFQGRASNTWSVAIERIDPDGTVHGRVTYWGVRCKAHRDPIKNGRWQDGVLRLSVAGGPECGDLHFELRRGERRLLEGTGSADVDRTVTSQVWLDRER